MRIPGIPGNPQGILVDMMHHQEPQFSLWFFLVHSLWIPGLFLLHSLVHQEWVRNIPEESTGNPGNTAMKLVRNIPKESTGNPRNTGVKLVRNVPKESTRNPSHSRDSRRNHRESRNQSGIHQESTRNVWGSVMYWVWQGINIPCFVRQSTTTRIMSNSSSPLFRS